MPAFGNELEVNGTIKMDAGVLTFPDGTSMKSAQFLGAGQGQAGTALAVSSLPADVVLTDSQTPQTIANQTSFTGNVSIGTSSSATSLTVQGVNSGIQLMTLGATLATVGNKGWNIRANYDGTPFNGQADSLGYEYWNGINEISPLTFLPSGNIGIGTTTPGAALEVNGNIKLTAGTGASITFPDGTVQSTAYVGTTCPTGGDYAESVDVVGDKKQYEPGDVIVIGAESTSDVTKSTEPYSTLVAGIYSTKPGFVGRRQTTNPKTSTTEVPMAMVGIVPTKVSAENGPIHRGDLLVTSSTAGYAMKGTDRSRMVGAVVGKAMGSLESEAGVIEVLVSLQ